MDKNGQELVCFCVIISVAFYRHWEENIYVRQGEIPFTKGSEGLEDLANSNEYILRMVLELIDKCESLQELRKSVKNVLDDE